MQVSVITAVYNAKDTIQSCINSVKSQSYKNVEHIIIDGGSTDGTIKILEENDCNYVSEPDFGIYDAFNKGVKLSAGKIIHILNADDYYAHNNVIASVVEYIKKGSYDLVHARVEQFSKNAKKVFGRQQTKNEMLTKFRVAHPSVFVIREVYDKYGLFSEGYKIAGDHEFLLRIWDEVDVGFMNDIIVRMMLGGASNSQIYNSYKESLSVVILHGKNPLTACVRFYWELIKNKVIIPVLLICKSFLSIKYQS